MAGGTWDWTIPLGPPVEMGTRFSATMREGVRNGAHRVGWKRTPHSRTDLVATRMGICRKKSSIPRFSRACKRGIDVGDGREEGTEEFTKLSHVATSPGLSVTDEVRVVTLNSICLHVTQMESQGLGEVVGGMSE